MRVCLDWRDGSHWSPRLEPCVHCHAPTNLRTTAGQPAHKTCVERVFIERRHLRLVKPEEADQ